MLSKWMSMQSGCRGWCWFWHFAKFRRYSGSPYRQPVMGTNRLWHEPCKAATPPPTTPKKLRWRATYSEPSRKQSKQSSKRREERKSVQRSSKEDSIRRSSLSIFKNISSFESLFISDEATLGCVRTSNAERKWRRRRTLERTTSDGSVSERGC